MWVFPPPTKNLIFGRTRVMNVTLLHHFPHPKVELCQFLVGVIPPHIHHSYTDISDTYMLHMHNSLEPGLICSLPFVLWFFTLKALWLSWWWAGKPERYERGESARFHVSFHFLHALSSHWGKCSFSLWEIMQGHAPGLSLKIPEMCERQKEAERPSQKVRSHKSKRELFRLGCRYPAPRDGCRTLRLCF